MYLQHVLWQLDLRNRDILYKAISSDYHAAFENRHLNKDEISCDKILSRLCDVN